MFAVNSEFKGFDNGFDRNSENICYYLLYQLCTSSIAYKGRKAYVAEMLKLAKDWLKKYKNNDLSDTG